MALLNGRLHLPAAVHWIGLLGAIMGSLTGPSFGGTMITTPELRQAAMTSCTADVLRLCPTVLFDEQKIFACMRMNRPLLSPSCGAVFDQGAKTVKH